MSCCEVERVLVGSSHESVARFVDANGDPYDPPVVLFKLSRIGFKAETVVLNLRYSVDVILTRVREGEYRVVWAFTSAGRFAARWQALESISVAATAQAASEELITVEATSFAAPILPA